MHEARARRCADTMPGSVRYGARRQCGRLTRGQVGRCADIGPCEFVADWLGPVVPRVRMSREGLLLRPWFRRSLLVPWTRIKGVRIAPADRWSGKNAIPGDHGRYMVQVKTGWRLAAGGPGPAGTPLRP